MVIEHIQKLLFNHDCVIIPDFGGLITHYEPARIHPIRHSFMPPTKRVAFNEQLKLNDGLLISTLAYDKKLSSEEAQVQVSQFVYQLQQELNQQRKCEFKGIGIFKLNAENKIIFEYIENENLLNDSFGLPELISKPVTSEPALLRTLLKEQPASAQKGVKATFRKYYRAVAALTVVGVAFTGLYFLSLQKEYNVSAINPITLFQSDNQNDNQNQAAPAEPIPNTQDLTLATNTVAEELELPVEPTNPNFQDNTEVAEETTPETAQSIAKEKASYAATTSKPIEVYNKDKVKIVVNTNTVISVSPSENEIKKPTVSTPASRKTATEKQVALNNGVKRNYSAAEIKAAMAAGKVSARPESVITGKPLATPNINKLAPAKPAPTAIKNKSERFYVIVNGYSTYESAERNRKIISKKGRPGKVLPPAGDAKLYRIAIAEFTTKEQALQQLPELKNKYGNTIWILKN